MYCAAKTRTYEKRGSEAWTRPSLSTYPSLGVRQSKLLLASELFADKGFGKLRYDFPGDALDDFACQVDQSGLVHWYAGLVQRLADALRSQM